MKLQSTVMHTPVPKRDLERETLVNNGYTVRQMTAEERTWMDSLEPPKKGIFAETPFRRRRAW